MVYYVTNRGEALGKRVEAETPEEAVKKSRLHGMCTVRWGHKWGLPAKPGTEREGVWWFAHTAEVPGRGMGVNNA